MIRSHNIDWNYLVKTPETASFNISKYKAGEVVMLDPANASADIELTLDAVINGPVFFVIKSATTTYAVKVMHNSLCYSFASDLTLGSASQDLVGKVFVLYGDDTKWSYEGPEDVDFDGDLSVDSLTSAGDITIADGKGVVAAGASYFKGTDAADETAGDDIDVTLAAGGDAAGAAVGGDGGSRNVTAGAGGAADDAFAAGAGGDLTYTAGAGGAGDDDAGALGVPGAGGTQTISGGAGGAGTAATQDGAAGGDNVMAAGAGGAGGVGTTSGAGGDGILRGGAAGANGGGGAGDDGKVKIGDQDTDSIEIGNATDNPETNFLGTGDVNHGGDCVVVATKKFKGLGDAELEAAEGPAETNGFDTTFIGGDGGAAAGAAKGGVGGGVRGYGGDGGAADAANGGGAGGQALLVGGDGGAGSAAKAAGAGGAGAISAGAGGDDGGANAADGGGFVITAGAGGSASVADVQAGGGGDLTVAAGAGGAGGAAAAVGGDGGDLILNAGAGGATGGAGAGVHGLLQIGAANTDSIEIGNATDNPDVDFIGTGTVAMDGPLEAPMKDMSILEAPDDEAFRGITMSVTAGENVSAGDALYLKNDGKWWKADADVAAGPLVPSAALATADALADADLVVLVYGTMRQDANWALATKGGVVYLGVTPGTLTQTAPANPGDAKQRLGIVTDLADTVFFCPSIDVGIV